MTRKLEKQSELKFNTEDIINLIKDNDLTDPNTFIVLNGGTGTGKTHTIMEAVKPVLEEKFKSSQSMLVVESRTLTADQLNENYNDKIETIGGIDVCQRLAFMNKIARNEANYKWIVIDECHGLFSEADFAEDAEYIASWIRSSRGDTHIIFVTANDEYFEDLSRKYFPGKFNFIYLFPDFTQYVSRTYVKEIQFFKTNRSDTVIQTLINKMGNKKGIVFLKSAAKVRDWYFKLYATEGIPAAMLVSQANKTNADLTVIQEKQAQDMALDLSGGRNGLTMADVCTAIDVMRQQMGYEGVREALVREKLPDDIQILLATDTLQEGASVKSDIEYMIVEGFTEVEVRQKLGRFRGNLTSLFIVFNPVSTREQIVGRKREFERLLRLQEEGNQGALGEAYGAQKAGKFTTIYVKKKSKFNNEKQQTVTYYEVNMPAYLNSQREYQLYNKLINATESTVLETYSYPLLNGEPQIVNFEEIRNFNLKLELKKIVKKWVGIPLKGPAQQEIVQDFKEAGITDKSRHAITSFPKICSFMRENGISISEKQASSKDLDQWPQFLNKPREKFKFLSPQDNANWF